MTSRIISILIISTVIAVISTLIVGFIDIEIWLMADYLVPIKKVIGTILLVWALFTSVFLINAKWE